MAYLGNRMVTHLYNAPDVFRALADSTRRAILDQLLESELCVLEIAEAFDVSRPAVSKHLRILREAKLVSERREGRERLYALNPRALGAVDGWLGKYRGEVRGRLQRLKRHVESHP